MQKIAVSCGANAVPASRSSSARLNRRASRTTLLALALYVTLASPQAPADAIDPPDGVAHGEYFLEVNKRERQLLVKNGTRVERRYNIATGRGGNGDKRRTGDKRTPVGTYRIVDFNERSRFHFFMHLNYPNVKDAFFGLKGNLISRSDFDRIVGAAKTGKVPPQTTPLGGFVGIHGLGDGVDAERLDIHVAADWTEGCIALTNEEIEELKRYVRVGTKVVINE